LLDGRHVGAANAEGKGRGHYQITDLVHGITLSLSLRRADFGGSGAGLGSTQWNQENANFVGAHWSE
jgi:hypothetical protein